MDLPIPAERPRVQRLDPQVVAKIAAGEMILRPLSAAKELVENSLDARATRIEVALGDRADVSLSVSDDGIGMTEDDLRLALETHATSKLRSEEDLLRVGSLGFRGEALPSIGRVSRMEVTTSPDDSGLGHRARMEGGELRTWEPTARSRGTTVRVEDLFFNSPVRKRFLKSASAETRAIKKLLETYALAYPQVHFRMEQRGESLLDLPAAGGLADRVVQLHGAPVLEKLLAIEEHGSQHHLIGFVGVPELARAGTQHQTFLVNGRWVGAPWLSAAVRQAFGDLLPPAKHPWLVLLLGVDPSRVDVNVHPTKREIRFLDEAELFGWIVRAVRNQLASLVPTWNLDPEDRGGGWSRATLGRDARPGEGEGGGAGGVREPEPRAWNRSPAGGHGGTMPGPGPYAPRMAPLLHELYRGPSTDRARSAAVPPEGASREEGVSSDAETPRYFQLHHRYVVAPTARGFLIIDQHAAHERILYERFLRQIREEPAPTQQLLAPLSIALEPEESETFSRFGRDFLALGLDVEEFGGDTVLLRGVPALWSDDPEQHFRDVLADLSGRPSQRVAARAERLAASFACRSAIRSGRVLAPAEMARLVDDLFATEMPHGDPHGRPTYIEVDLQDLDTRFGRH